MNRRSARTHTCAPITLLPEKALGVTLPPLAVVAVVIVPIVPAVSVAAVVITPTIPAVVAAAAGTVDGLVGGTLWGMRNQSGLLS